MKKTKHIAKRVILCAAGILAVLGLGIAYLCGHIGLSEDAMLQQELDEHQESRPVYCDQGESVAVFLEYRDDLTDIDVDIYVKRPYSLGWFFRFGSSSGEQDCLVQMNCEGNDEYVLLYLCGEPVSYVEIEKEDGTATVFNPEMGKPFACVIKHSWNVTVYDQDGGILTPQQRNM